MLVRDVVSCLEQFRTMFNQGKSFTAEYSGPWHFNKSYRTEQVPFAKSSGIYIYTRPALPDWKLNIQQNDAEILYIGKSNGGIAARVWQHMGLIFDPETGQECDPRFKYHQWANEVNVPDDIRRDIANGDIVVYTICIEPGSFEPQVIEKYLIACFYRAWDRLPILNKDV